MQTHASWKTEISDLLDRARAVTDATGPAVRMSPREVARCLSGVVSLVARRWSVDTMQRACAEIVRCEAAWRTNFRVLPMTAEGRVPPELEMIAVIARGILPLAGAESMRAALSFWAVETDAATWQSVTGIAA